MIYIIAYYLASLAMAFYLEKKKDIKFEATIDGRKLNQVLTTILSSPLTVPFMLIVLKAQSKK